MLTFAPYIIVALHGKKITESSAYISNNVTVFSFILICTKSVKPQYIHPLPADPAAPHSAGVLLR